MNTFPFYRHVIELYAFLLESHLHIATDRFIKMKMNESNRQKQFQISFHFSDIYT